jgi:hypothetical protein
MSFSRQVHPKPNEASKEIYGAIKSVDLRLTKFPYYSALLEIKGIRNTLPSIGKPNLSTH